MTPIPIEDLPDVLDSFVRILLSSAAMTTSFLLRFMLKDIMALEKAWTALSEDTPYLPSDMISAFIDMNVPEELMGNGNSPDRKGREAGRQGQGIKGSASTER